MILQVPTQRTDPSVKVPERTHATDAAYDLCSTDSINLAPGDRQLFGTGLHIELPEGYCGLVLPRSGLADRHGVTVLNSPGLIDSGYRGEVSVLLINHGFCEHYISEGDRVAQLLVVKALDAAFVGAVELGESDRGSNGFGSSGV